MKDENDNRRDELSENESIYDELKGFFPEDYDLSPDEFLEQPDMNSFENDDSSPIWEDLDSDKAEPAVIEDVAETPPPRNKTKKLLSDVFDILEMFTLCTACIIIIFSLFARLTIVDGESMENTLMDGEFLVISKLFYEPKQGDIVVLQNTRLSHTELKKPLVKRIIAVGGETVDIADDGTVTVTDSKGNANVLKEDYIKNEYYRKISGQYDVPEGYVFVMGDNRNNSTDSRDSRVGVVDERCIVGRALVRILPFNRATVFENPFAEE